LEKSRNSRKIGRANTGASVTIREAYGFFAPLIFMAELHMLSHAVISAFLARMPDPEPILAAYSMAFYLHATLGSPVWACQFVAISYIKDRKSVIRLLVFSVQTFALVGWAWALIALTPLGIVFFGMVFGASEPVAAEAQKCMIVSTLIVPCVFFRSIAYALLMLRRRTTLVTLGTLIRLIGLFGILAALQDRASGPLVGMAALTACIAIESVYAVIVARKYYLDLPASGEPPPSYKEMWRFGWPVMLMQAAESGVAFTVGLFLGRLVQPELALAAFGVLDAMMRVLLGPLRNLTQAVQTLTRGRADAPVIGKFAVHLAILFGLAMCVFQIDVVRLYALENVMGLPRSMADYIAPALALSPLLALCMTAAAFARGQLLASRRTNAIAAASTARILAVGAVGAIALSMSDANGAVVGVSSLIAAFATEAAILGGRVLYAERRQGGLFQ
jgi:O-antigen/teichoic acid export membrane protein